MIDDFVHPARPAKTRRPKTEDTLGWKLAPQTYVSEDKSLPEPDPVSASEAPTESIPVTAEPAKIEEEPATDSGAGGPDSPEKPDSPKKFRWPRWLKNKRVWIGVAAGLLIIGAGVAAYIAHRPTPSVIQHVTKPKPKPSPKPTTVPSNLTGLPVDPSVNQRPVTGVMIENSDDARPQSGLDQAGIVFEAVAEGGVTRFLALFQDTTPAYIGPVRSLRPYYLQWCMSFDCAIAHVGGSPDALADVNTWGAKNLDQFYNAGAYTRISSRYAPHNVYTSLAQLNQLEASKGFGAPSYTGFARKADQPLKTPTSTSIDTNLSGPDYAAHFDYNAATNTYTRSEAGAPHIEVDTAGHQTPITPKVVIAMVVPESQGALDASGAYYSDYNTIGSGQAYVFQDGGLTIGTWAKNGNGAPLTFADSGGETLKLNAGQTWIVAITGAPELTYK